MYSISTVPMHSQTQNLKLYTKMRKLFIIILFALSASAFGQVGWVTNKTKVEYRDSTKFTKNANFVVAPTMPSFKIGAVTVTANGTELNILDNALVNTTELNYLVGVTSSVQTQLNAKAPLANPNFTTAVRLASDSLLPKARLLQVVADVVADTFTARIAAAGSLSDYAFMKSSANTSGNAVTLEYAQSLLSSSSGSMTYQLKGIIDGTYGLPVNGDSLIINSQFHLHPRIFLYRDGVLQYKLDNNLYNIYGPDTYCIEYDTMRVNPVFSSGEKILVFAQDESAWQDLVHEGGDGAGDLPGNDSLYTIANAYGWNWQLDGAGNTLWPTPTGDYAGTAYNSPAIVTGKYGNARSFVSASSQYINFGTDCGNMGTDDFTVSTWVYVDANTSANRGIVGKWKDDDHYWRLDIANTNYVRFYLSFDGLTSDFIYSNSTLPEDQWVNLIVTVDRSGLAKLYVNGSVQATTLDISANAAVSLSNTGTLAIGRYGDDYPAYMDGIIDDVYLFKGTILTSTQIADMQIKTFPFND